MMEKPHILLADEDSSFVNQLKNTLTKEGYDIHTASKADEALELLQKKKIDLLITNLQLTLATGNRLYRQAQTQFPSLPVLLASQSSSLPEAMIATQKGIFAFLTRPIESQQLTDTVRAALTSVQRRHNSDWRSGILTHSDNMEALLDQAQHVAESYANVVIVGESGSGRKQLAKAIHAASPNRERPFISLDCAHLNEDQLNANLLGTLTNDTQATLFLDHIHELSLNLQIKLLKALQECLQNLTGQGRSTSDLRIISSSSPDLEQRMAKGDFDRDLFYLLNVVGLTIPPLRERVEDIPLLTRHFLAEHSLKHNRKVRNVSPGALHLLAKASWTGNIRQLGAVMKQVVIRSASPVISESLVSQALADEESAIPSFNEARSSFEREYLVKVLQVTEGNVTHAARIAQRNRTDFYKLLNKHELNAAEFKKKSKRYRNQNMQQLG